MWCTRAVMRAYKFLDVDGRAPFTAHRWPTDGWVEAAGADPCHDGVHACTTADLAHWLHDDLWEVELDGEIVATRRKVAARRGRLVRPVAGYRTAVADLAAVGAWRSRDRAVAALRAEGDPGGLAVAERLEAVATLEELAALGSSISEDTPALSAAALAADAAHFALRGEPTESPFVAACSAGHCASLAASRSRRRAGCLRRRLRGRAGVPVRLVDRPPGPVTITRRWPGRPPAAPLASRAGERRPTGGRWVLSGGRRPQHRDGAAELAQVVEAVRADRQVLLEDDPCVVVEGALHPLGDGLDELDAAHLGLEHHDTTARVSSR